MNRDNGNYDGDRTRRSRRKSVTETIKKIRHCYAMERSQPSQQIRNLESSDEDSMDIVENRAVRFTHQYVQ